MKLASLIKLSASFLRELLLHEQRPLIGSIIITDRCNLQCRHCSVNNIIKADYTYEQIKSDMEMLHGRGSLILFVYGGEPFLWRDQNRTLQDLVIMAKDIGFLLVNVVTNGTHPIDIPEVDLFLVSVDGDKAHHNLIRGNTYDNIIENIDSAISRNIVVYMAVNRLNKNVISQVGEMVRDHENIIGISFNLHTPYPGTESLALSKREKQECCEDIAGLMDKGIPVFNLKSVFPYLLEGTAPVPCHQCAVVENGIIWDCGRCIDEPGLCQECGYLFAYEYSLAFDRNPKVIIDMIRTYLRFI